MIEIRNLADGEFDELVAKNADVHIEMLEYDTCQIVVTTSEKRVAITLSVSDGVNLDVEIEDDDA